MIINKIKSDVGLLIIGNLLNAIYLWSVISILARKFDIGLLGQYTLSLSIVTPIFCFVYFGFRILLVTDIKKELNIYKLLKFKTALTIFFVIVAAITHFSIYRNDIIESVFYFVLFYKLIDSYYDFFIGVNHRNDNIRKHGAILIVRSISLTLVFILGSYYFESYNISFSIVLITSIFILYYFELKSFNLKKFYKSKIDIQESIKVSRISFPIVSSAFVNSILVNVPNYYISYFYNAKEVGFYAIFYSFNVLLNIVIISLGQYYLREISKDYNVRNLKKIKSIVSIFIICLGGVSISAFLVSFLIGDYALKILFGENALHYSKIFPYLFLFSFPVYLGQILSYVVTGVNQVFSLLLASSLSLFFSVLLGYYLISMHPIWGSFITLSIVGSIQTAVFLYYINKSFKN